MDTAIDEISDEYMIRQFLVANRGEIKNMFLTEYNQEKVLEKERTEERAEGRKEGYQFSLERPQNGLAINGSQAKNSRKKVADWL